MKTADVERAVLIREQAFLVGKRAELTELLRSYQNKGPITDVLRNVAYLLDAFLYNEVAKGRLSMDWTFQIRDAGDRNFEVFFHPPPIQITVTI